MSWAELTGVPCPRGGEAKPGDGPLWVYVVLECELSFRGILDSRGQESTLCLGGFLGFGALYT